MPKTWICDETILIYTLIYKIHKYIFYPKQSSGTEPA